MGQVEEEGCRERIHTHTHTHVHTHTHTHTQREREREREYIYYVMTFRPEKGWRKREATRRARCQLYVAAGAGGISMYLCPPVDLCGLSKCVHPYHA